MIFAIALPQGMPTMEDVIRVLAIVGGAAVGAFATGFLTQVIVRGYTGQQVPRWVVNTLRVLGGISLGWLVYLLVYSQGQGLFGGFGGGGVGKDGAGNGDQSVTTPATSPKDVKPADKDGSIGAEQTGVLRIEVLGEQPLQEIAKRNNKPFDPERCYRISDADALELRTLREVRDSIRQRVERDPPLRRIELILYKDSPQKKVGRVSELKKWADDLTSKGEKVLVDYKEPGENAPLR